ncbi:MAG: hypothetical protein HKN37_07560, partial [Rhodothermales bacterium]|nr:hypothetical protein [Rhodothermales bacterium]
MLEKAVEYREQAYFDSALASLSEAMAQFYAKRDTSGIAWGVLEAAR